MERKREQVTKSKSALRRVAIEAVVEVRDARNTKRGLEEAISDHQAEAVDALEGLGIESIAFDDPSADNVKIGASVVRQSTLQFDETKLRKKLGVKLWNRISTRHLDRSKLEQAVADGIIDAKVVAACSEEKAKKPFIRITEKVERR